MRALVRTASLDLVRSIRWLLLSVMVLTETITNKSIKVIQLDAKKTKVHLPMQLSAVQVIQELLQLARLVHVLVVIEQIHVPERVDGDQWQVRL